MAYLDKTGLQHLIEKIKNRVIPIDKGGTGATTTTQARHNLFNNSPLSVEEGGTGVRSYRELGYALMFVREYVLDNQTISAGTAKEITYVYNKDLVAVPPILVGWYLSNATSSGQNVSNVSVYGAYITEDGDKFVIKCKNTGSSTAKVKAIFKVLTYNY